MIRSMTGYARFETHGIWGRLNWEFRSVNHRYLDLQFKLPDEFRVLEAELRVQAADHVARGKVECSLRFSRESTGGAQLEVDPERLAQVLGALAQVEGTLSVSAPLDPLRLLQFPGVIREEASDLAPVLAAARSAFQEALKDFADTRSREGGRLQQFLLERCDALRERVQLIRLRYPFVRTQWLERLRGRAEELKVDLDAARVEQELVIALQRLDVEEELSRLESHLAEVAAVLGRGEAVGRRLDFLMQELNREANTLSSKSQDAEMTRHAVEMKVIIEQMREQVQNIE